MLFQQDTVLHPINGYQAVTSKPEASSLPRNFSHVQFSQDNQLTHLICGGSYERASPGTAPRFPYLSLPWYVAVSCECTRIHSLHASTAVQLSTPAVQGADHEQNAPLLQASDVPVNIVASESVSSIPDLPNEFKGAERALQAWQQHKFALWLYMVVSGLVVALSVQNRFLPTILPATLGQQLAMWGLLFLTWQPDRKLRNIDEFLQASKTADLRQAKCVVCCKRTCFAVIILLYCQCAASHRRATVISSSQWLHGCSAYDARDLE